MRGFQEALVETGRGRKTIRVYNQARAPGRPWDLIPLGNTLEYSSVTHRLRDEKVMYLSTHTSSVFA